MLRKSLKFLSLLIICTQAQVVFAQQYCSDIFSANKVYLKMFVIKGIDYPNTYRFPLQIFLKESSSVKHYQDNIKQFSLLPPEAFSPIKFLGIEKLTSSDGRILTRVALEKTSINKPDNLVMPKQDDFDQALTTLLENSESSEELPETNNSIISLDKHRITASPKQQIKSSMNSILNMFRHSTSQLAYILKAGDIISPMNELLLDPSNGQLQGQRFLMPYLFSNNFERTIEVTPMGFLNGVQYYKVIFKVSARLPFG